MIETNKFIELLPFAPVYDHPLNDNRPVYFSDVVILKDNMKKFPDFASLKGHTFAQNDPLSLSGNIATLSELKKMGASASFFGNIINSGSHHGSLNMILSCQADVASIDSNVLCRWSADNPQLREKLHILCSWGPLPAQPIILNKRLPEKVKQRIASVLKNAHQHPVFAERFLKHRVKGFAEVDDAFFDLTKQAMQLAKQ